MKSHDHPCTEVTELIKEVKTGYFKRQLSFPLWIGYFVGPGKIDKYDFKLILPDSVK